MSHIQDEMGHNQVFRPSPASQKRMQLRAEKILATWPRTQRRLRILELGCGSGELTRHLLSDPRVELTAIDVSEHLLEIAKSEVQQDRVHFIKAEAKGFLSQSGGFDGIVGNGFLHHVLYDLGSYLGLMSSALASDGKLVFWEPNLRNPYVYAIFSQPILRRWAQLDIHEMAFDQQFISKKLQQFGFQAQVETRDFLLPNAPSWLIEPSIKIGSVLEKSPLRFMAQSLFIVANK